MGDIAIVVAIVGWMLCGFAFAHTRFPVRTRTWRWPGRAMYEYERRLLQRAMPRMLYGNWDALQPSPGYGWDAMRHTIDQMARRAAAEPPTIPERIAWEMRETEMRGRMSGDPAWQQTSAPTVDIRIGTDDDLRNMV